MPSARGQDLEAEIAPRFGTSRYVVIVDLETVAFEAVPNPGATAQCGASMHAVALAVSKDAKAVPTGYFSPAAQRQLSAVGIEVVTGSSGMVREVVQEYKGLFEEAYDN